MIDMVGPLGQEGCSKMNCLNKYVNSYVYDVAWPGRAVYAVRYRWCEEHDHVLDKWIYPNFELRKEGTL